MSSITEFATSPAPSAVLDQAHIAHQLNALTIVTEFIGISLALDCLGLPKRRRQ